MSVDRSPGTSLYGIVWPSLPLLRIMIACHGDFLELDLLREYAKDPEAFDAWRRKHGHVEKEI